VKDALRLALARLVAIWLAAGSRPFPFQPGPALIMAPHADDETLGCGGVIAAKTDRGDPVTVVFLTDSAGSHPGHPALTPGVLAATRRQEARAALGELGVDAAQIHFLDAPDGRLDRLDPAESAALKHQLAAVLAKVRPAEIFLPYLGGGSSEHDAAHRACRAAVQASGLEPLIWEYPIWAWWNALRLRGRLFHPAGTFRLQLGANCGRKRRALACHRTQVMPATPWLQPVLPPVLGRLCTGAREFFFIAPSD